MTAPVAVDLPITDDDRTFPCDAPRFGTAAQLSADNLIEPCRFPAAWIAIFRHQDRNRVLLVCHDHADAARRIHARQIKCKGCGDTVTVDVQPITPEG